MVTQYEGDSNRTGDDMTEPDYRRDLARMEAKIDRVQDAIVSLARMEERMITLFHRMDNYDSVIRETERRVAELERLTIGRGQFFRWLDRGGVAVLGAAVALAFRQWG